jgi:hypothetical protein
MILLRMTAAQAAAGPLTELTGFLVEIVHLADTVEQAGCIQGRVRAARFVVNEYQAQGAGPQFAGWHGRFLSFNAE